MSLPSTLTHEQLEIRRRCVGASESAAVLGLSPFRTAADVYYEKVGDLEPGKPNDAQMSGIALEPVIVQWAAQELGVQVRTNCGTILHPSLPLGASPDGLVVSKREGVEAKMSSMPEEWGEPGTDQIPDHYLVQTHQQMFVLGLERVWVPVLLLAYRPEWRMYCVNRNDDLGANIAQRVTAWWKQHVETRTPPDNAPPPMEFLKRLRRQPASTVMLGQNGVEAWDAYEKEKALCKEAEERKEMAQAKVLAMLGTDNPAECGVLPDGRQITFFQQRNPPSVDKDLLRAKWPDAFEACVTQTMRRQLRIKKGK